MAQSGWVGVQMQPMTPALARALGLITAHHLASAVAEIKQLASALETV